MGSNDIVKFVVHNQEHESYDESNFVLKTLLDSKFGDDFGVDASLYDHTSDVTFDLRIPW